MPQMHQYLLIRASHAFSRGAMSQRLILGRASLRKASLSSRATVCLMNPERQRIVDPPVRTTIDAMLADPARTWSVAALAMLAGLSRAAFARRFVRAAGIAP